MDSFNHEIEEGLELDEFSPFFLPIIELKSNTAGDAIRNLAIKNKLIYDDISCEPESINFNNQAGDIIIKPDVLRNKINWKILFLKFIF